MTEKLDEMTNCKENHGNSYGHNVLSEILQLRAKLMWLCILVASHPRKIDRIQALIHYSSLLLLSYLFPFKGCVSTELQHQSCDPEPFNCTKHLRDLVSARCFRFQGDSKQIEAIQC